MDNKEKIEQGKNGLRSYQFEKVKRGKRIDHYHPTLGHSWQEFTDMFYTKKCLYCIKEFEARRVDTAFCCQGCQKAHLRLRKKML